MNYFTLLQVRKGPVTVNVRTKIPIALFRVTIDAPCSTHRFPDCFAVSYLIHVAKLFHSEKGGTVSFFTAMCTVRLEVKTT